VIAGNAILTAKSSGAIEAPSPTTASPTMPGRRESAGSMIDPHQGFLRP